MSVARSINILYTADASNFNKQTRGVVKELKNMGKLGKQLFGPKTDTGFDRMQRKFASLRKQVIAGKISLKEFRREVAFAKEAFVKGALGKDGTFGSANDFREKTRQNQLARNNKLITGDEFTRRQKELREEFHKRRGTTSKSTQIAQQTAAAEKQAAQQRIEQDKRVAAAKADVARMIDRNRTAQEQHDQGLAKAKTHLAAGRISTEQYKREVARLSQELYKNSGAMERDRAAAAANKAEQDKAAAIINKNKTAKQRYTERVSQADQMLRKNLMTRAQHRAEVAAATLAYQKESGALDRQKEAQRQADLAAQQFAQSKQRAKQIIQGFRSPLQNFRAQLREINKLHREGAMTAQQHALAEARLRQQFNASTGGAHMRNTGRDSMARGLHAMGLQGLAMGVGGQKFRAERHAAGGQRGSFSSSLQQLAPMAGAFGAVMTLHKGIKINMEYGKSMSRVEALTNATGEEMRMLSIHAQDLGRSTMFSAKQAADAMAFFSLAGFEVGETMAALEPTLNLAAAGQIDMAEAADITSKIMKSFRMEASEIEGVVDMMAVAMTESNTNISQLGHAMKFVGPIAHSAGVGVRDVTSALMVLANAGLQGEMGGTSLRNILLKLSNPSRVARKTMDELGLSVADNQGNFKQLNVIVDELNESMKGMGDVEKLQKLNKIFEARAAVGAAALMGAGGDEIRRFNEMLEGAHGRAKQVAEKQLDNLWGQWELLKSAAAGFAILFGEGSGDTGGSFLGAVTKAINFLADYLRFMRVLVTAIIGRIAQGLSWIIKKADEAMKTLTFGQIGVGPINRGAGEFLGHFGDETMFAAEKLRDELGAAKERERYLAELKEQEKRVKENESDPLLMAAKRYEEVVGPAEDWLHTLREQVDIQEKLIAQEERFRGLDIDVAKKIIQLEDTQREERKRQIKLAGEAAFDQKFDQAKKQGAKDEVAVAEANVARRKAMADAEKMLPTIDSNAITQEALMLAEKKKQFDANRKLIEQEKQRKKSIEEQVAALQEQAATVGLNQRGQLMRELNKKGATPEQVKLALKAFDKQEKIQKDIAKSDARNKRLDELEQGAFQLTAQDKLLDGKAELDNLRKFGLSDAAYFTELNKLANSSGLFKEPDKSARTGAIEKGTAAAFSQERKNRLDRLDPILNEEQKQTKLQEQLVKKFDSIGVSVETSIEDQLSG